MTEFESMGIIVWGTGYLGYSDMIYYTAAGCHTLGIDINAASINARIKEGTYLRDLVSWYVMDTPKVSLEITSDHNRSRAFKSRVHFICVPTEKNGRPWDEPLWDVISKIMEVEKEADRVNVLIESTLTPGTARRVMESLRENLTGKKIRFGVAPRRDWFVDRDKNLTELARVYGTESPESDAFFREILGKVCSNLVVASSYEIAEMTKSVENSLRHICIMAADQLADAFPEMDIREVLALAGTKWNIETYRPSFGPGGYCIPLSSKYLISAAKNSEKLSIFSEATAYMGERPYKIAREIIGKINGPRIGILGTMYEGDIGVDKESPVLRMMQVFKENGLQVFVHDVFLDEESVKEKYGVQWFDFIDPAVLQSTDCLIINTAHSKYIEMADFLAKAVRAGEMQIFDNTGILTALREDPEVSEKYHLIGTPEW